MSKLPKRTPRELPDEGTHNARCVQVIDLGTQDGGQFGPKRKIQLAFQLVDEKTKKGEAMVAYRQYTFSSSQKSSLVADLKAWLGVKKAEDFDMDDCLGKEALVTVVHNETDKGTFANITNVGGVPRGAKVAKPTEPLISLYLDDTFDRESFGALPEFLQAKIAETPEYEEFGVEQSKPTKGKGGKTPAKGKGK